LSPCHAQKHSLQHILSVSGTSGYPIGRPKYAPVVLLKKDFDRIDRAE
jgi:hypothetical protein